ncbi:MAG TPA: fumarylacetoacetate hydrolase family protein, partial [Stenotrophomonas sp.]|nr:fumarylacetoacetate hydrolase family protein [Stenotrophomonas sp.]
ELVVALGQDAPAGVVPVAQAEALVYGYGVGLDLTRRDLQAAAKAKGLPWDIAKGFDYSAPVSELVHAGEVGALEALNLSLEVNGEVRQQSLLDQMIWNVPEILHELSKLYALKAGDLVFMGTPAGVAALKPGDRFSARLENVAERHGVIAR